MSGTIDLTGLLREIASYIDSRPQASAVPLAIKASEAIALAEQQEREWANCAQHLAVSRGLLDAALKHNEILIDGQTASNAKIAEMGRQLAALLAEIKALPCYPGCGYLPCSRCFLVAQVGMQALDAHDEQVRREALEEAADECSDCAGQCARTGQRLSADEWRSREQWLRDHAKGCGNGA